MPKRDPKDLDPGVMPDSCDYYTYYGEGPTQENVHAYEYDDGWGLFIDSPNFADIDRVMKAPVCECGSDSVKSPFHSIWCMKNSRE